MIKRRAVFLLAVTLTLAGPVAAKAADLPELTKYLGLIEGFQYMFEYCQTKTKLSSDQVKYARGHIAERRALIFAGLDEAARKKISVDAQAMKKLVLDSMMKKLRESEPNWDLGDWCKGGLLDGVIDSEQKSETKEVAAIRKAKT